MIDKRFFEGMYQCIEEYAWRDAENTAWVEKNKNWFTGLYNKMANLFVKSEDDFDELWVMWLTLEIEDDKGTKEDTNRLSLQEIRLKYEDIDIFFGILCQCMNMIAFRDDFKLNESRKDFIEKTFEKLKRKLNNPTSIQWKYMWQKVMNSSVYSRVVKELEGNERGNSMERYFYVDPWFLANLMDIDSRNDCCSLFYCVLKTDYIGYDIPNPESKDEMKGVKRKFEEIIRSVDKESQIETIFTHNKKGNKRPIWEVSAIDSKSFYRDICQLGDVKVHGYSELSRIYNKYCSGVGAETSYSKIKDLISCFEGKDDCVNWYLHYKRLDKMAELLCELVPVTYYMENGKRQLKQYMKWKEECELVIRIIRENGLPLEIDPFEAKAVELTQNQIYEISRDGYEKDVHACFKERYLDYLCKQNEKFSYASNKVYCILKNVKGEENRAKVAKAALDSMLTD